MKKQKELLNTKSTIGNFELSFILIAILAGIPFLLGRYFEINYPDPFDSAANVYDAQHILNGVKVNVDFNQSPAFGTLLVNIIGVKIFGFSEFGPKMIQAIMQGMALILTFVALKKLMGRLPAAIAVIVAAIYTSSPFLAKFGNVKEQYMIACMMMAISFFVLRQIGGGWWWAVLAGATTAWAPLFKETGISVIIAIGIFVILQPFLKNRTFKQTAIDIGLLMVGAFCVVIIPLWICIIILNSKVYPPYHFVIQMLQNKLHVYFDWSKIHINIPREESQYLSGIQKTLPFSEQWPRVLRFYLALILPVALALGSILVRIIKLVFDKVKPSPDWKNNYDRFVILLAIWWLLDMAFVWISPASYEQYYLPLTASGSITGAYLIAVYRDKLNKAFFKTRWVSIGIAGLIIMVAMTWNIFVGRPKSAYSGMTYPERRYGYLQRWNEISMRRSSGNKGYWEIAGEYIRDNTKPTDKIYVWGWYPGIYLSAQRFSSAKTAFYSDMHTDSPPVLEKKINELLTDFQKEMPKYIVDSRKQHLPLDRFKFELWPIVPEGFMGFQKTQLLPPKDPGIYAEWETKWGQLEKERFGEDEFRRFEIMGKFRKFVRENYEPANVFGDEVVLKLKTPTAPATKTN
jgi:hypothetical protein